MRALPSRCGHLMLSSWSLARRAARARVAGVPGLGFRKSFENCQTQLNAPLRPGPRKIDQLLVLLYASFGRTRSRPRVLEVPSRRVAAAWTKAQVGAGGRAWKAKLSRPCLSAAVLSPAPARVGLQRFRHEQATSSVLNFQNCPGRRHRTISTEGQPPPCCRPRARPAPPRRPRARASTSGRRTGSTRTSSGATACMATILSTARSSRSAKRKNNGALKLLT